MNIQHLNLKSKRFLSRRILRQFAALIYIFGNGTNGLGTMFPLEQLPVTKPVALLLLWGTACNHTKSAIRWRLNAIWPAGIALDATKETHMSAKMGKFLEFTQTGPSHLTLLFQPLMHENYPAILL